MPSISPLPEMSKVAASISPVIVMLRPPVISLLLSATMAFEATTVPAVLPSNKLISAAVLVTPSRMLSSEVLAVSPLSKLISEVLAVSPSTIFSSVCVAVTAPDTLGNVAFTVDLIRRKWSSACESASVAAGLEAFKLSM